jgi:aryl-alcohol dehydrogenase (NADP+)
VTPDAHEESWERRNTERNWRTIEVVAEVAGVRRASHSQVALAWLRAKPAVTSVILGVRTLEQLQDNLGAAQINLSEEEIAWLDRVSAPPELYPYRLLEEQYESRMAT